jgi:alpha-beta hydrolase superfamily lysophospholipase
MSGERTQAIIDSFTAGDGYRWQFRRYEPIGPPRGIIVCLHGIQSHGGWYEYSSTKLCEGGYRVLYLDRRGSGLNAAARGDAPNFGRLLDDLSEFLAKLHVPSQNQPRPLPVFLSGVSWGGKLAVALQPWRPGLVNGLILLCPGLFPRVGLPPRKLIGLLVARLISPDHLFPIPLNDPQLFTASPRWQAFIRHDPLALHQATARFMVESVRLDLYLRGSAKDVTVPTLLLLAGKDRIIRNGKTQRYFQKFATVDKNVITYAEAHHTLEFEPEPDRFLTELLRWLGRQCREFAQQAAT